MVLVGLVDGGLALAEVLKASVHFTPEIQITDMGRCTKGTVFLVADIGRPSMLSTRILYMKC